MKLENKIAKEDAKARIFVESIPDWKFPNKEVKFHFEKNLC